MASLIDKMSGINGNCNNENGFRTCIRDNANMHAQTGCYGSGTGTAAAPINYQVNLWYHCVGTVDMDDSVRIYIDGNVLATQFVSVGLSGLVTETN